MVMYILCIGTCAAVYYIIQFASINRSHLYPVPIYYYYCASGDDMAGIIIIYDKIIPSMPNL